MTFDEIVQYIKEDGCRVYVYNKKQTIYGGNRGTFDCNERGPIICMAGKIDSRRRMETLLHEYGHFLQWKDGFIQYLDGICEVYTLEDKWLSRKVELSPKEIEIARRIMLTIEYDAERRALKAAEFFDADDFHVDWYVRGANSYMAAIKWGWLRRKATSDVLERRHFQPVMMTNEELYAPLDEKLIKKMDKHLIVNPHLAAK